MGSIWKKIGCYGISQAIFMVCLCAGLTAGQIEINKDRISVQAQRIPLQDLMKQLSDDYGITVRIDPAINPAVTISFSNRDLQDGLKAIIKPNNHVFIWRKADDSGSAYALKEIQIFQPGQKDRMVSIDVPRRPIPPPVTEPAPEPEFLAEPEEAPTAEDAPQDEPPNEPQDEPQDEPKDDTDAPSSPESGKSANTFDELVIRWVN